MKNHANGQRRQLSASKQLNGVSVRYGTPTKTLEAGKPVILCPFCTPTHPLSVSGPSACGTMIEIRASQPVYKAKLHKDMVCVKCKQGGGSMIQFNDMFIHTHDCVPGVTVFTDPSRFSRMAKIVYHAPALFKANLEKRFGVAKVVNEVTPAGESTGRVLGYYFQKA